MNRIASNNIKELKDNEVFVFGSNTQGAHGGGAARFAMNFGAVYGQAFGLQGKTFAIPTVDYTKTGKISVSEIKNYVDEFLAFTLQHKELNFLVTEIGCGIAGFKVEEMAELFREALKDDYDNVYLPQRFYDYLNS
ncbi:hypothetical protein [Brachyspira sp.]|uniref:A1S_2505 family phage non-structural protein n=1 Tax=Brachyspira sp. TaxID=1977261 RepID=UPI00260839C3|nr:hypothetical protein [Brachyspira sp.]